MYFRKAAWLAAPALLLACAGPLGTGAPLPPKSEADVTITPAHDKLAAGELLTTPFDFKHGSAHYVGGVASGLVPATPERVLAALDDVGALDTLLPRTKRATLIDTDGSERRVELLQGNSFITATYTVDISPSTTPGELTFRLDRSRRHDIADVYGYFKVRRFDDRRSVVTVAAAVDIGSGLPALFAGKRVQDIILSAPRVMRNYFARRDGDTPGLVVARVER